MNKVFRYPYKIGYPVIVIIAIVFGLIFYGFFRDAYSSQSNGYMAAILIIFGGLYYSLFIGFKHNATKIIVNDDALIIDMPFKDQRIFRWHEIKEFGRYKKAAPYSYRWFFYFKTMKTETKKILLFSELIVEGQDLIDTIFSKAVNAKFVVIRNISLIPFIKKNIIENWKEAKDIN
jgi:hypothetical protein